MSQFDKSRHLTEEELIALYFGEETASGVESHAGECPQCNSAMQQLKSDLASVAALAAAPEPGPGYEDRLWKSLVARDPALGARRRWRFLPLRNLAWAAGLAAMVLAAFLAGRFSTSPRQTNFASNPGAVRERLLVAALADHLEQSERILLEIDNLELQREQERAESLLAANRLYRQTAVRDGKTALAATLEDLERVLIDVARAPGRPGPVQLRALQARVEEQGLLFKIQALGSRLRRIDAQPASGAPGQFSKSTKG